MPELRASARLRNKATSSIVVDHSSTSMPQKVQRKRRKVVGAPNELNMRCEARTDRRGIQGKLKLITEMPFDILCEIFSFLEPVDLLHLSGANKVFRGMLLSRQTNHIWKGAFMNVERDPPPQIPEDMTYPSYALLLYGTYCNHCGQVKTSYVHWAARLRLCAACIKATTVSALRGSRKKLPDLCPSWYVSTPLKLYATLYMKEDYQRITQELDRLKHDENSLSKFVETQKKFHDKRVKHATQCERWVHDIKMRRENEIKDIVSKRKEAICLRLRQEGWSNELDYLESWGIAKIPEVKKAQELTEKIWSTIHPRIITYLEDVRLKRLEGQRQSVIQTRMMLLMPLYKEFLKTLPHISCVPGFPDLCAEEPFRSLIFSTPIDTTLEPVDFVAHKEDIARACEARSESQKRLLEVLLPPDYPSLDLAMALFSCRWCGKLTSYPDVLQHHCLIESHNNFKPSGDNAELYKFALDHRPWDCHETYDEAEYALLFRRPWNFGGLQVKYDEEAAGHAKAIIELCGVDPHVVSKKAMDELEVRIECLRCGQGKRGRTGRLAMAWSVAVTHELGTHLQDEEDLEWDGPRWKLLDAEDLKMAKSKELRGPQYPVRIPRRTMA